MISKRNMKKALIVLLILSIFLVSGCVKTLSEAKDDKYLNKTIKVCGQVNNKVGSVEESGFSLVDNDTYIFVGNNEFKTYILVRKLACIIEKVLEGNLE